MLDFIVNNAPIISLIFFFSIFCALLVYLLRPKTKKDSEKHAQIPLKEDD